MGKSLEILKKFGIDDLPDLDVCVLGALELFAENGLPSLELGNYKRPLVLGSGNAEVTGRIIFENYDAVFANESTYEEKLKAVPSIDGAILISASGGKHAIGIAKRLKELGKECRLLTCNREAPAKEYIDSDKLFVFPKNREPYTYNTSTYMGMILASTKEDPKEIQDYIEKNVENAINENIGKYEGYYLMLPSKFDSTRGLFITKFVELFGRKVGRDVFTDEQSKHATTVVPSNELFIEFGETGFHMKGDRLQVPLPKNAKNGTMMAIAYYVIGKIQAQKPPYFKQNIKEYCKSASELFDQQINPIVE